MSPIDAGYPLLFASGLLGGFGHCLGMCGPLAAALSSLRPGREGAVPVLLYHLGRITTYSLLGGVAGAAGSFLAVAGRIGGAQRGILFAAGILTAAAGLWAGGWIPAPGPAPGGRIASRIARATRHLSGAGGPGAWYPLGLLLGFLPCGLVYAALLAAAGNGVQARTPAEGFLHGFLSMTAFGLGTAPALLLLGTTAGLLAGRVRAGLRRVSSLLLVAAGLLFVYRGIAG